jgi:DNA-binding PucR family transcriptional regulator
VADSPQPHSQARLSLTRFVRLLGPSTVELLASPPGVDLEVAGPRIYDPLDPGAIGAGDVVLGINVRSTSAQSAIADASAAGAAAIALKGDAAALAEFAIDAVSAGVALLGVSAAVTWDQMYALTRNATAAAGAAVDENSTTPLGDLFALANALAAILGGAVTIEDARATLLAYSNLDQAIDDARRDTILGRGTTPNWAARLREEGIIEQLRASPPRVVHVHDPRAEARDRLAIAIRAGAEMLGTIWVVEGDAPLDERAQNALHESAPLAALHLLRHRASEDLTRGERGNFLHALLEGQRRAADVAVDLGVDQASPCAVVAFNLAADDDLDRLVKRTRATDLIVLASEAFRRRVVCTGAGATVYALFPSLDEAATARLHALVRDIATRATETLGIRVVVGIGSTVPTLDGAQQSRREADRVVRVLTHSRGDESVAGIDEVQVQVRSVLLELGDAMHERPHLRLPALDVIAAYDRDHSKTYMETLLALVEASWDTKTAAARLGLHPNSLRYRLRRIEDLSGLRLDNPETRLVLSLQLFTP